MSDRLPVIAHCDLLILGGSSGAVSAALAAAEAGASVQVVAPRPYLGSDICARFAYWPDEGTDRRHPLAARLFPDDGQPVSPMTVKRTLEQALVAAGIPILLNSHPAGVLRDGDGRICGAVIANRAGRQAIRAGEVIDASDDAATCRLAGLRFTAGPSGEVACRHVVLGGGTASGEGLSVRELPAFTARGRQGPIAVAAREYRLTVDCGDGSWQALARARAEVVRRCWSVGSWLHSEVLEPAQGSRIVGDERLDVWPGLDAFPSDVLQVAPGLHCLGAAAPLGDAVVERLREPAHLLAVGAVLGRQLGDRRAADPATVRITCAGAETVDSGELRSLRGGLRPTDQPSEWLDEEGRSIPRLGRFDVVVVGGGTGGAPAAIAAGRNGASTLVCEHLAALGGVGTLGQIANYYYGNRVGFTAEIDQGVRQREPEQLREGWWTPATKAAWYHDACAAAGVVMAFGTTCCGAWVEDGRVRGVIVAGPMGYGLVEAGAVVDASGCADVVAAAGGPTVGVGAGHCAMQGTGLAGLNPDKRYNNSDHSFSDDTDVVDATRFLIEAKEKFRDDFDAGQLVDSRERRQIVGEISLEPVDFLCERRFPDTITIASSNFDTHGFVIHPLFLVKAMGKDTMSVHMPYRCLLPQGLDGVLATGLGVSAHRDALPVIRMQPDVQNHGYAAGRAAAMAAAAGITPRQIDVVALQRHLVAAKILPQSVLVDQDTFPVAESRLRRAVADALDHHAGIALCFAEPRRSPPLLRAVLMEDDAERRLRAAQILALMGHGDGVAELARALSERPWDAGWNYTGMGQFGMSTSDLDGLLIAWATVADGSGWELLETKATALAEGRGLPDLSHCRALAVACERLQLRHPDACGASLLAGLLALPGVTGHSQISQTEVQAAITTEQNETGVRNDALRELHLARACFRCGDHQGLAQGILERYARDLRGLFARHASAVLAERRVTVADPM